MDVRHQLGVVALGIVDEIARVNLEKLREKEARGVGGMWPRAALDLREVRLADGRTVFATAGFGLIGLLIGFLDGTDQLLLCHCAVEASKIAFDLTKIADFVAQFHIADCNESITICNKEQEGVRN